MRLSGFRSVQQALFFLTALTFVARSEGFTSLVHTNHNRRPAARILARNTEIQAVGKSGGKLIETEDQYSSVVLTKNTSKPVLVFFSAPWCGPCRLSNPVVKEVMKQFSGKIDVVEVCTDDLAEVAAEAGVTSIPTIQFYYGGTLMDTIVGCVAKGVLANAVDKVLEETQQAAST